MRCLVTGALGQDGHYLAKQLTEEGHEVFCLIHRQREQELPYGQIVRGDLSDALSIFRAVEMVRPDEIYNMGAVSHVLYSFAHPEHTMNVNGLGFWRLCEAAKQYAPNARLYQASTAELYGNAPVFPANEDSPMEPVSPYGLAKYAAHKAAKMYRSQGLWCSTGICFSHVSPRSGREFVINKFIQAAVKVHRGEQKCVPVGTLTTKRDFGWSPEYCAGIIRILRYSEPTDMVLASGVAVEIGELADFIFSLLGLNFRQLSFTDPTLVRPTEVQMLCGDASKAKRLIDWNPTYTWKQIAGKLMEEALVPKPYPL